MSSTKPRKDRYNKKTLALDVAGFVLTPLWWGLRNTIGRLTDSL